MLKEIDLKASMAYNDDDFRDTVAAFCDGKKASYREMQTKLIISKVNSREWKR